MTLVTQILDSKGRDVWFVAPGDSVFEVIKLMAEKGVGALLVMENDKLLGIVSERDYARKVILQGRSSETTPVGDIMTRDVISASPQQTIEDCMTLMTEKRIRHLPVVDDERVDGVLSIGDLVKSIIAEQQFQIEQLENYISA
jgi:CBS domain-containing protein